MVEAPAFHRERLSGLRASFARECALGTLAGAVVLVTHRGEPVWHEAFGSEHPQGPSRPMRLGSVFRIAAMTRPVVAVATLSLAEEGRLALERPVAEYLPELSRVQVGVQDGDRLVLQAPRRAMTVADLLRHTAGFTYGMFGDSLVQRLYREASVMDPAQDNAQMVRKLADLPLQCQPGEQFEYGMSTDVLGRVLEVVTGQPLAQVLADRVTRPLAMHDTGFHLRAGAGLARARSGPPAVMFDYDEAAPPAWQSAGAGLLSTAADYARFCGMLLAGGTLDGVRVLGPESVAAMLADQLPRGVTFGTSTTGLGINAPIPAYGQGHGFGVGVRCRPDLAPVPGNVGDFFWGGALGPYFWADPREQLVAVLMLQENDIAARAHWRALLRHGVYAALD